jgi:hypothetical protein
MGGLTTSTTFLDVFGNPNASLLGFLVSSYEFSAMFGAIFVFLLLPCEEVILIPLRRRRR